MTLNFYSSKAHLKITINPKAKTYPYLYHALVPSEQGRISTTLYLDSIDEYIPEIIPDARDAYLIPRFEGVPDRLNKLVNLLGQWDVDYPRSNPERLRIVYDKKMCLDNKLLVGAYFDIDDNRVVNTSGFTTHKRLQIALENRRKPKPDKQPLLYIRNVPPKDSARHVVTQLILLREAGQQQQALDMLSEAQTNNSVRNEITKKSSPDSSIDINTFTYQVTDTTYDSINVTIHYLLENGSLIETKHQARLEQGKWTVFF